MSSKKQIGAYAFIALGMMAASCSHDESLYTKKDNGELYKTSFEENIMGGRAIDQNQIWNTAIAVKITIQTDTEGTVKVYADNPMGKVVAPLVTTQVKVGENEIQVAKPADVEQLYVAMVEGNYQQVQTVQEGVAKFAKSTAAARLMTRAPQAPTEADWTFASAPTDADFAYASDAIPADALLPTQYGNDTKDAVHNYKLAETTDVQNVQFYNGNFNLYISGTKTINYVNPGDGSKNMNFYVMPGANVTFTQNFTQKGSGNVFMYIPASATVNFAGGLQAYITLYNRGTVNVSGNGYKPGIYDGGIFFNEGTFNVTGSQAYWFGNRSNENVLTLNNGNSQFINAGTLNAGALTLEGSSHFLNMGNTTITGASVVNSNQCTWVNEGQYTTGYFIYNAGSTDVRNNCHMTVTQMFTINLGDTDKNNFTNNAGASVVAKNFEFQGPGYIKMGAGSLFKVEETATMNITKPDYGFWGPASGSEYAVLQAKDIVKANEWNSKYVTYGGNLYVACDSHFANGWSGQYPYYYLEDNAKIANGQNGADYSIPASTCSPGYNDNGSGGSRTDVVEPTMYYYYAFEDLGGVNGVNNTDIDFNDIVLRVSAPVNGNCDVELVAAGGELSTKILYNGTIICEDAHQRIGGAMLNTGNVDTNKFTVIYELSGVTDASDLPFAIEVKRADGTQGSVTVQASGMGEAPLMIKVAGIAEGENTGKWFWVKERTSIKVAYPLFVNWAENRTVNTDWYKNFVQGNVVSY